MAAVKGSIPEEMMKFHGKYAQIVSREPLCTVAIHKSEGSLGVTLAGGGQSIQNASLLSIFEYGDEIVAINGVYLLGKTLEEAKAMCSTDEPEVEIIYRRLPEQLPISFNFGLSMKKAQQLMAENLKLADSTLDLMGVQRATLQADEEHSEQPKMCCSADGEDELADKKDKLDRHVAVYNGLAPCLSRYITAYARVITSQEDMSKILTEISIREGNNVLREPVLAMAESHKAIAKHGRTCVDRLQRVLGQIETFLSKVYPDIELSVRKYEQHRVLFLANSMRVFDMQARDQAAIARDEGTPESLIGNYELRDALRSLVRCRRLFERIRADLIQKLDLLRGNSVRDICTIIAGLATALHDCIDQCAAATSYAELVVSRFPDDTLHRLTVLETPVATPHGTPAATPVTSPRQ